jgi:hypothetical protein
MCQKPLKVVGCMKAIKKEQADKRHYSFSFYPQTINGCRTQRSELR